MLHDLTEHGDEADWRVFPRILLFTLFKNGCEVSLLYSLVTSPDCHDFSDMLESSVANTPSNTVEHTEHCGK